MRELAMLPQPLAVELRRAAGAPAGRVAVPGRPAAAGAAAERAVIFQYGALAMAPTPFPLFEAIGKGLIVRGYTLFEIVADPEKMARGKKFIYNGLASGALKPIIARTFPLEKIVEAHRFMESNQQMGKIVVTVE